MPDRNTSPPPPDAPFPVPPPGEQDDERSHSRRRDGGYPPHYGCYGYGPHYSGYGYGYDGGYGGGGAHGGPLGAITISRLLRVLRRKALIIVAVAVFGMLAGWYCRVFRERKAVALYRVTASIEMSLRKPRVMKSAGPIVDEGYGSSQESFNTRLAKFRSTAMHQTFAKKLHKLRPNDSHTDAQLSDIVGALSIKLRKGTRLLDITFTHTDPRFAADVANAFAAAAETNVFDENRLTTEKAVAWLQARAVAQCKLLTETERTLGEFRAQNNLDVIEGQRGTVQESIKTLSSSAASIESGAVLREEMLKALDALKGSPEAGQSLPSGVLRGDAIQKAVDNWRGAQRQRDALKERYTPEHPEMMALETKIGVLDAEVIEKVRISRTSIASDIALLRQQSKSLQERMVSEQKKLTDLERQLVETRMQLTTMERERAACDIAYRGILNRIEEARLSADENTAIVKLVEAAGVPTIPVRQRQSPFALLGLLFGFAGGMVLALVTDTLEDHVTSLADIEHGIGLKVLGIVPRVLRIERSDLAKASLRHRHGQLTEFFAGIRTILNSAQYKEASKSILISSAAPEEGKTIVSCNLAIGSAKSGKKTLLVDFDMRRPRLSSVFGRPEEEHSLLKALAEGAVDRFASLPMSTECENLHVISTRSFEEGNPAEIMAGQIVPRFFDWANEHYDRIIVDSPPCGVVSDASVLAGLVQSVIMICRPDRTRRRNCRHAVRHFTDLGANVIGAIVNDVDFSRRSYFSSDYYQHPYYDRKQHDYYDASESGEV